MTRSLTSESKCNVLRLSVLPDNWVWCLKISSWGSLTETLLLKYGSRRSAAFVWPAVLIATQQQPQWNSELGSSRTAARLRSFGRQSRWYQASQSSHCTHCTVSCCGRRQHTEAHGSTPCTALVPASFSSSSSSSEEDDAEDDEQEEELDDDEEEAGDGSKGWGGGCFLGLPRRLLQRKKFQCIEWLLNREARINTINQFKWVLSFGSEHRVESWNSALGAERSLGFVQKHNSDWLGSSLTFLSGTQSINCPQLPLTPQSPHSLN